MSIPAKKKKKSKVSELKQFCKEQQRGYSTKQAYLLNQAYFDNPG